MLINYGTIHHDPKRHGNPYAYDPSRYINDHQTAGECTKNADASKRDHFVFGAGRRVCQGMHIAERSLFLAISRMLWAFDIKPPKDSNGESVLPDPAKLTQGLFVLPEKFEAVIVPRSEKKAEMVRKQWKDCTALLDDDMQWRKVPEGMMFSSYDPEKQEDAE